MRIHIATLLSVGILFCISFTSFAQEADTLKSLLVDLSEWEADDAGTASMDAGDMKFTSTTRNYSKGDSEITAIVIIGNQATMKGRVEEMKAQSAEGKVAITQIDGFKVQTFYDKTDKSGGIIVTLNQTETGGALLCLNFAGVAEKEAMDLAKKFDWKKIQEKTK